MVGELRSGKLHGAGKKKVLGDLKAQRKNVETYACERSLMQTPVLRSALKK